MGKARRKDKDLPPPSHDEHKLYLEDAVLERKIPDADLRQLVELPSGLDLNEWLASHTLSCFEHINLIYGTVSEFCTMSGCPDMVGPAQRQYQWYDEKGKKCKVAAPQYVDYVMTFIQKTINDECIFPSKFGNEFPSSFESIVKKIHRLLFHVLAHIYYAHFKEIWMLGLHSHLNCLFAHFILFNERFKLVEEKETEILNDLIAALKLHPDSQKDEDDDSEAVEKAAAGVTPSEKEKEPVSSERIRDGLTSNVTGMADLAPSITCDFKLQH